jgi:hypothetical protein
LHFRGQTTKVSCHLRTEKEKAERSYVELSRCSSVDITDNASVATAPPRKKRTTTLRSSLDGETVSIYLTRTQSGASILSGTDCVSRLLVAEAATTGVGGGSSIEYHKAGDLYARRRMSRPLTGQLLTNGHHR